MKHLLSASYCAEHFITPLSHLLLYTLLYVGSITTIYIYIFKFYLFIYFWLCWHFVAARASLQLQKVGAALCSGAWASHCSGISCCGTQALGHPSLSLLPVGPRAQVQWLRHMGLVALRHVGSSWTGNQIRVSCISQQTLYH